MLRRSSLCTFLRTWTMAAGWEPVDAQRTLGLEAALWWWRAWFHLDFLKSVQGTGRFVFTGVQQTSTKHVLSAPLQDIFSPYSLGPQDVCYFCLQATSGGEHIFGAQNDRCSSVHIWWDGGNRMWVVFQALLIRYLRISEHIKICI